jgi:polyhydroxyalkanoate synthesis regulator phasin
MNFSIRLLDGERADEVRFTGENAMRFGAAALTLAFGVAVVGMASAQESSSWLPRWLAPAEKEKADPDKVKDKTADKGEIAPKVSPPVNRSAIKAAKKAKADWERRIEVIDKLRHIADDTDDEDLRSKVERLEKRAWDLYIAATNIVTEPEGPAPVPDAKKGSRK